MPTTTEPRALEPVTVYPLGRLGYDEAFAVQTRVQADLIAAKRDGRVLPHALLLVEHDRVVTLGASANRAHVRWTDAELAARGVLLRPIDRGGDVTYHGPGQLVGYPVLDLERFTPDLHRYLRALETLVVRVCAGYGIAAGAYTDGAGKRQTGVWVGPPGQERKICAFGIRCTRWVTKHGFALNVSTDLDAFDAIIPCGIAERGVTSLSRELGRPVALDDAIPRVLDAFADGFGAVLTVLAPADARARLGLAPLPDDAASGGILPAPAAL